MEAFLPIRAFVAICLVALFAYTIYLIRTGRLSAHLAINWIVTEALLMASLVIRPIPDALRSMVGERDYYTAIAILVIGWITFLMLDTLTRVSEVEFKSRTAIQENALLTRRIEELETRMATLADAGDAKNKDSKTAN